MPLLAAALVSLLGGLAGFLVKLFLGKLPIKLAAVAAFAAVGVVMVGVFNQVVAPLAAQVFSTQFGQVIGLAFPPVSGTCLAAVSGLWIATVTYSWQVRAIKMTASV